MIIVDQALEKRERDKQPIRVGMIGAGFMARGIALQMFTAIRGMRLVAISNRSLEGAVRAYREAGVDETTTVHSVVDLEDAIKAGRFAVTDDALLLARAGNVDVVVEVTGTVEFGAQVVFEAIKHGKHVVMMNAELDGTIGPILKVYADKAGVVITNADGDQPGVIMNLYRFVKGIGVRPLLCGNIKGLQDPYRNPTTQESFARQWKQKAHMVTSFADGTKVSFEQAIVANATRMRVAQRGMYGPTVPAGTAIQESVNWFPLDEIAKGPGVVDYVVGAAPGPGVFVIGEHPDPMQQHYLNLYKLGAGPYYCFYTPYHLCHFEVHNSVARAALFQDAAITPAGSPMVEVIATAKTDLKAGAVLDGLGWYMTYGQCENSDIARANKLLPIGIAEGCILKRDMLKDDVLTYDDVMLPKGRLCDELRRAQDDYFDGFICKGSGTHVNNIL